MTATASRTTTKKIVKTAFLIAHTIRYDHAGGNREKRDLRREGDKYSLSRKTKFFA
jgi:hypothetical protein